MAAPAPTPNPQSTNTVGGRTFWNRITDGLETEQLWRQFRADARTSYQLYKSDAGIGETHSRWEIVKAFFWAVMRKLTPARRVLLLFGAAMALIPTVEFNSGGDTQTTVSFHFLGTLMLLAVLMLEMADRVTMKRDLEIAREIQSWLIPQSAPQVPGLDIAFVNRPANTVAGDYYDVIPWGSSGRAVMVVADVAGKSIPAGLLMATFQASLKTLLLHTTSLMDLIHGLNEYASAHSNEGRRFTTAFLADYDPVARTVSYVNAGHNAPILRRANGAIERLELGGLPFGIHAQAPYEIGTLKLERGDMLMVFTDGMIEAVDERGEEYGETRLLALISSLSPYSAQQGVGMLMDELRRFTGMAHQHDDMTCLLVKVNA